MSPPRCASAKPKPPGCATCLSRLRRERRLAQSRPGRRRSDLLEEADLLRPGAPDWPAARSPPSATASCASPPGSPAPHDRPDHASTPHADGPLRSAKPSTGCAPRSPDCRPTSRQPAQPEAAGKPQPGRPRTPTRPDPRTSPNTITKADSEVAVKKRASRCGSAVLVRSSTCA
jgi:hypothetical protein